MVGQTASLRDRHQRVEREDGEGCQVDLGFARLDGYCQREAGLTDASETDSFAG